MPLLKKLLIPPALILLLLLAYLLLWPVPFEPVAWQAPTAPGLAGQYAVNNALADARRISTRGHGPEDVAVDGKGRIYSGYADGSIRRTDPETGSETHLGYTGGRPLGLAWGAEGSLVIADAIEGLMVLRPDGRLRTLAHSYDDMSFSFVDDVDVDGNGDVYFSDASDKFGFGEHLADILEFGGRGRLFRYKPLSDTVELLMDGLQFANGVAMGPNDEYVMVTETAAYRVTRYWLKGPKQGEHEVVIDNLPGLPDGISHAGDGKFWIALYAPRNEMLDFMADKPWLRKLVFRLPAFVQPEPKRHAMVLGIDADGNVTHNLQHAGENAYAPVTSVEEVDGKLFLGSLEHKAIAVLPAP